ncbi:MAG: UDP-N-acetylmuramate:L-alanyl-gamma-D-glutamyl-meso-diaminopimelate ligase [Gammaproteobacteria bacterium]|nr:UDP-N-acetylmuramate:L-alanyl-gamma-D-glutamyl-meso-diaminopimelate ligase [Gammaproteobacteria bacterium]
MHIHILGICGTFMGGIALLARQLGYTVSGCDTNVYPPMSTQLSDAGIRITEGFGSRQFKPEPDLVVVGNALSRGNPAVEYMLERGLDYTSGPAFLANYLLKYRWVLAVAGTHGKTTTSSMLAWILEYAGLKPGFLIGGIPENFGLSARQGNEPFFVVEADEYDSAFFDKRSKFIHYRPRTLVLNNLEFDHADIFDDLAAIQKQFHHLVRTVPGNGLIVAPCTDEALIDVLAQGLWTQCEYLNSQLTWHVTDKRADGSQFTVMLGDKEVGRVDWSLIGEHNISNGLAAIVAARHAGVIAEHAVEALCHFKNVKRRMEVRGCVNGITVYDDFAHHPTAIASTLQGLRHKVGSRRIIAILEPRSNTMQMGVHRDTLAASLSEADQLFIYQPDGLEWDSMSVIKNVSAPAVLLNSVSEIVRAVIQMVRPQDHVLIMSNGGFGGIHDLLINKLKEIK